jgi:hypothetical protein
VPSHHYVCNVKVHNVFKATSLPLVQSTVELELITMHEVSNELSIKKDHISIQSNEYVRFIRVKARLHLQVHTYCVQVPLGRMFLVVLQF